MPDHQAASQSVTVAGIATTATLPGFDVGRVGGWRHPRDCPPSWRWRWPARRLQRVGKRRCAGAHGTRALLPWPAASCSYQCAGTMAVGDPRPATWLPPSQHCTAGSSGGGRRYKRRRWGASGISALESMPRHRCRAGRAMVARTRSAAPCMRPAQEQSGWGGSAWRGAACSAAQRSAHLYFLLSWYMPVTAMKALTASKL